MKFSLNDVLILEPYQQGQGLRPEIKNGFAFVQQKNELKGLKLLVEAQLSNGTYLPAGSTVYISEELLSSQQWAKHIKKSEILKDQPFIAVELKFVVMVDTNENFVEKQKVC